MLATAAAPLVAVLLELAAVALSVLGILAWQWITLWPRLGVSTLVHLGPLRLGTALLALGCAAAGLGLWPAAPTCVLGGLALALTPLSGALRPTRFLRTLDDPQHGDASAAPASSAAVVGCVVHGQAHAYAVETLYPHHIVNDVVAGLPVAACW